MVVDGNTNRIIAGWGYDGNGNVVYMPGFSSLTHDVSNRLASASPSSGGTEYYAYEPTNQRVWKKKPGGEEEVYFSTPEGEKLATYNVVTAWPGYAHTLLLQVSSTNLYFGGKLIREAGTAVVLDRLASRVKHFPYGEEYQSSAHDRTKFATYYRDATTALDYAQNRYYASTQGRFLTPDPYVTGGGMESPQSLNQYAYAENDPANRADPHGLYSCFTTWGGLTVCDESVDQVLSLATSWQTHPWCIYLAFAPDTTGLPIPGRCEGFLSAVAAAGLSRARFVPDRVVAMFDCVGKDPFAILGGAVLRQITYVAYAGIKEIPPDYAAVISENLIWSYGPLPNAGRGDPAQPFFDEVGTRNRGDFGLTQQFFVAVFGGTPQRVQIQGYGESTLRWENIIKATNDHVWINDKEGPPCK